MAACAAGCLGLPASAVFISETNTSVVANTSPSAASASADLYGSAIVNACGQLTERLKPYREKCGGTAAAWKDIVTAAYMDRCDLSAHGFFATGGLNWDWAVGPPGTPCAFVIPRFVPILLHFSLLTHLILSPRARSVFPPAVNYHCFGAAASEVEVDTLTGDCCVLRTDIVMDVGESLNPAIDVGQVEGGYVQGLGWLMLEELKWGDCEHPWVKPGRLHTQGPGTYKIPSASDIPLDFRVSLLKGAPNPRAVFSSKAVGEPPFLLAMSTFFAAKAAVGAARADAGLPGHFALDAPATPERLRLACSDSISAPYAPPGTRAKLSC